MRVASPNRTIDPLPKLRSIWDSTRFRAFCFSGFSVIFIEVSFFAIWGTRVGPLGSLLINCTTRMLADTFNPVNPGLRLDLLCTAYQASLLAWPIGRYLSKLSTKYWKRYSRSYVFGSWAVTLTTKLSFESDASARWF